MLRPAAKCSGSFESMAWLLRLVTLLLSCLAAPAVFAVEQKAEAKTPIAVNAVGANELANVTLGLLIVLALIFGLAWLFRRYGNLTTFNRSNIQILGGVSLGPREKAILLEVEGERLLVGVASGQVTKLHSFPPAQADANSPQASDDMPGDSDNDAFAKALQHETAKGGEVSS